MWLKELRKLRRVWRDLGNQRQTVYTTLLCNLLHRQDYMFRPIFLRHFQVDYT
jgi:hypothetical protein